ncbi:VAMP/synaptobrevin-like protein [Fomitiporia mediterranea MF3/22]|uniref:VAMP/synaptobrevin-like protein n=1 Tax=Fomitiporia mediterranea (strain MF3/22) TaxID=694068 RepID=UPI0004408139|nr:VAMP/synaptobrevin-like protein [Fomitiporia mediterranea MF3/22]EJD07782.1 VAMP/synaptobrevin-like protein [Fomitiporia mediterranea MF3/22]
MSLIHALVARGPEVLAEHHAGIRDFSQATQTILSKIPQGPGKLTYAWEQYLFHYVSDGTLIFLVMADDAAGRRMPFAFLYELERQFAESPTASTQDLSSVPSHGLQQSFGPRLAALVDEFNTAPPTDEITRAKGELAQVKDIMVQNVEQILSRGERIELLVDKTDNMASQATAFRRGARTVRRQQFWRNQKIMILSVAVALVIIWVIAAQFCGAGLNQCGAKNNDS